MKRPLQVRSGALRDELRATDKDERRWGAFMPDERDEVPEQRSEPCTGWDEEAVQRAIAAARQAGLKNYRVEIEPDGTIAIIVGD